MAYTNVKVPAGGAKISIKDGKLQVPDNPIIPFVEGDGTGRDIWRASVRVFDAAVEKAYKGRRKIHWMEVYAGEKSFKQFNSWLPDETIAMTALNFSSEPIVEARVFSSYVAAGATVVDLGTDEIVGEVDDELGIHLVLGAHDARVVRIS